MAATRGEGSLSCYALMVCTRVVLQLSKRLFVCCLGSTFLRSSVPTIEVAIKVTLMVAIEVV